MAKRRKNNNDIGIHKWNSDFIRQVYYLGLLGATDQQIADIFNVTILTVKQWKQKKPAFLTALKRGKERADAKVAHSMYKRATGYKYKDVHVLTNRIKKRDAKGKVIEEYTEPLIVEIEKEALPDVTAGFKWLAVRQPEKWSAKIQLEGKVEHTHKMDLSDFSTEELKVLEKLGMGDSKDKSVEDIDFEEIE